MRFSLGKGRKGEGVGFIAVAELKDKVRVLTAEPQQASDWSQPWCMEASDMSTFGSLP